MERKRSWAAVLDTLAASGAVGYGSSARIHRVTLYGPPGTGKSYAGETLAKHPARAAAGWSSACYRLALNEDTDESGLIGTWTLQGGCTVWVDGPAVRAMREGAVLCLDEIDRASPCVASALYAVMDDTPAIMLPTGETVRPAAGYVVLTTSNETPAALLPPIRDRGELWLAATEPHPAAVDSLPEDLREVVRNAYARDEGALCWYPAALTLRAVRSFGRLRAVLGEGVAAQLAWGEQLGADVVAAATAARTSSSGGAQE